MQKEVINPVKHIDTKITVVNKPQLPKEWDYDVSVKKTKGLILNWNKVTADILMELWIAREILSQTGRPKSGTIVPINKTWQSYCFDIGLHKRTANRWLARWTMPEEIEPPELPEGNFDVIYADPPWQYEHPISNSRKIEKHYPTMKLEDIKNLKIPSEGNAILFLWATSPKLTEALEVMQAWNFLYRTHAVWDKEKIGMGYWFRGQHELLLVGIRGDFSPPIA